MTTQTITEAAHAHSESHSQGSGKDVWKLTLGALGVVFGDIGTSPLYAIKESFHPGHGLALSPENIFGILSLVFWALTLVISVKYLVFVLRADNQGEGGITALLALLLPRLSEQNQRRRRAGVILLGLFGAGLLYGDGIITPAISVLSAVEGLEVATPAFQPFVVPLTVVILVLLFMVQKRGTAKIGAVFGPLTLVWFITLAATGLPWILKRPDILAAVNPIHALGFLFRNGVSGFMVLSAVVLCITGGEALYADMGHFGKRPIRRGWFLIVFPALLINYFGQGALVLEKGPAVLGSTFYGLVSGPFAQWMIYPVIIIATLATVIASQALISGAFSLTQQTVQLGFLPRTEIRHTSRETEGQIYIPRVNWFLMVACIALVLVFEESTNLAAAYGIAVTATMTITSLLFYLVMRRIWGWGWASATLVLFTFLAVDLSFFFANLAKLFHGGWVPVLIAVSIVIVMSTWKQGRLHLGRAMAASAIPLDRLYERIQTDKTARVQGTAVFLTQARDIAPAVLLHHLKHNQCLHEKVVLLSILTEHTPEVPVQERVRVTDLQDGFVKVVARYGYMEHPDVAEALALCTGAGLTLDFDKLSFYLGRESFIPSGNSRLANWRKMLFILLSRNARSATEFFRLPADQVIEIGSQIQL